MKKAGVFIFFLIFVVHPFEFLPAQNIKLGAEFGYNVFGGDTKKPDMVRESKSSSLYDDDYDYYCGVIGPEQTMNIFYLGLKSEFFFINNRLGIATGLRFSQYSSVFDSDRDYFLWQVRQEGVKTDYVKIRDITQNTYYLGLPLEIRFFPNKRELPFQHYFKIGSVFNYRIQTKNDIDFQNNAMNHYTESIENKIENPNNFNAYLYPAIGFKIGGFKVGNGKFPWINIEAHFPGIMLTSNASSFFKSNADTTPGFGIQFSIQIPLGKNSPIGSK
jgi:hypothetical protein